MIADFGISMIGKRDSAACFGTREGLSLSGVPIEYGDKGQENYGMMNAMDVIKTSGVCIFT